MLASFFYAALTFFRAVDVSMPAHVRGSKLNFLVLTRQPTQWQRIIAEQKTVVVLRRRFYHVIIMFADNNGELTNENLFCSLFFACFCEGNFREKLLRFAWTERHKPFRSPLSRA